MFLDALFTAPPAALLVRRRRSDLTARWVRRVLGDGQALAGNGAPALLAFIPDLLERIAAALEESAPESGEGPAGRGRPRAAAGCPVAQAARELSHLRAALLSFCAEEGVRLDPEEQLRVHAVIDEALGQIAQESERAARAALDESEARLGLATQAARAGRWDYDPTTGALRWDARCKELFGLPATRDGDYDLFLSGLHPDDRVRTHLALHRALDPESGGECRIRCRTVGIQDCIERRLEGCARVVLDDGGRVVRLIGALVEISDRGAVVTPEVRGSVARMVASASALLDDGELPEHQATALRCLSGAAERMARTLELLENSRRRTATRALKAGEQAAPPARPPPSRPRG